METMMMKESGTVKGIEVLYFEEAEIQKTKGNAVSFAASGPLSVLYFKDYDRFVLQLNDWKYPLLHRLPLTMTSERCYCLPAMNGFEFKLKINSMMSQDAMKNLETILMNNSRFGMKQQMGMGMMGKGEMGTMGMMGKGEMGTMGTMGKGEMGSMGMMGKGSMGTMGTMGKGEMGSMGMMGKGEMGSMGMMGKGEMGTMGMMGKGEMGTMGKGEMGSMGMMSKGEMGSMGTMGKGEMGTMGMMSKGEMGTMGMMSKGEKSPDDKLMRHKGKDTSMMDKVSETAKNIMENIKAKTETIKMGTKHIASKKERSNLKNIKNKNFKKTARPTLKKDFFEKNQKMTMEFMNKRKENPNMSHAMDFNDLKKTTESKAPAHHMFKEELEEFILNNKDIKIM